MGKIFSKSSSYNKVNQIDQLEIESFSEDIKAIKNELNLHKRYISELSQYITEQGHHISLHEARLKELSKRNPEKYNPFKYHYSSAPDTSDETVL